MLYLQVKETGAGLDDDGNEQVEKVVMASESLGRPQCRVRLSFGL